MPDNTQPTVLVKKSDGSTERVPLNKINSTKKQQPSSRSLPASAIAPIKPVNKPQIRKKPKNNTKKVQAPELEKLISSVQLRNKNQTKPSQEKQKSISNQPGPLKLDLSKNKPVDPPKDFNNIQPPKQQVKTEKKTKNHWDREDHKSLLEEKLDTPHAKQPLVSQDRNSQADDIIKRLNFKVSPDNQNRLRTLVQLKLKGVRSSEQVTETLMRPVLDGGLGLLPSQVQVLMDIMGENQPKEQEHTEIVKEENELPQVYHEPPLPAKTTPFNSFVHGPNKKNKAKQKESVPVVAKPKQSKPEKKAPATNELPTQKLNLNSKTIKKPVLHDVTPPKQMAVEMGPVQEIESMTLIDLRRLSQNPVEAASRLRQKFQNLKDESFVLFIEGMQAWRSSSLYYDYIDAIELSMQKHQPLEVVLQDKDTINAQEVRAIAAMCRELQ